MSMLFLSLGTGIGGGVVVDGKLRLGPLGAAGELRHQTILPGGPLCGCGNHGCLEALASGLAISAEGVRLGTAESRWRREREKSRSRGFESADHTIEEVK